MFGYSAKPHHYFISIIICVIAELARHNGYVLFSIFVYIVGMLAAFCITYSFVYEVRYYNSLRDEKRANDEHDQRLDDLQTVHVEMNTSPSQTRIFDLPASPRQLEQLASGLLLAGDSFSQKKWTGKFKPFSINQFCDLRDEMIKRGMIVQISEKDPRQGYTLTSIGRAVLKKFIPHSPTTEDLEPLQEDG